jgi:hypothetical protein
LNQPKKTPLLAVEALSANVPDAVSGSFRVLAAILSAQYAGFAERPTSMVNVTNNVAQRALLVFHAVMVSDIWCVYHGTLVCESVDGS